MQEIYAVKRYHNQKKKKKKKPPKNHASQAILLCVNTYCLNAFFLANFDFLKSGHKIIKKGPEIKS